MDDRNNNSSENSEALEATENGSDLSQFLGSTKEVVDRYSHCMICGANLHFTHQTDFTRNLTQEVAKCPECGIKARSVMHRLQ